jgi:hypothetical protein
LNWLAFDVFSEAELVELLIVAKVHKPWVKT